MSNNRVIGKAVRRLDAYDKAAGRHVYPSDFTAERMLHVKVLRTKYAHAEILSIRTKLAEQTAGVVKIITASDIPGHNGYGLVVDHQPVLCDRKVLHLGDVIAIVAAENEVIALQACALIEVEYKVLELLTDPEEALSPDVPQLHEHGNLCSKVNLGHGDTLAGFAEADMIFEKEYTTSAQEHAFLETEAGGAYYDDSGILTIFVGGQNPFNDHRQIAPVLGLADDEIRVINPAVGGAFGG